MVKVKKVIKVIKGTKHTQMTKDNSKVTKDIYYIIQDKSYFKCYTYLRTEWSGVRIPPVAPTICNKKSFFKKAFFIAKTTIYSVF